MPKWKTPTTVEELFEQLASLRTPPIGSLTHTLSDDAMLAIGKIVTLWSLLDHEVGVQIHRYKADPKVPKELRDSRPRPEFKHRLNYLKQLITHALADARPNGLKHYHARIGRVGNLKDLRDKVTHGSFNFRPGFDGVAIYYKGREHLVTSDRLKTAAAEISRCSGFFVNFARWNEAPAQLASLRKSRGRTGPA